jgi:hypothetical protein
MENQKIHLDFKNTMSGGQVPLAQSKEKMSFTIKKSRFTLTRVAGVTNKMNAI